MGPAVGVVKRSPNLEAFAWWLVACLMVSLGMVFRDHSWCGGLFVGAITAARFAGGGR